MNARFSGLSQAAGSGADVADLAVLADRRVLLLPALGQPDVLGVGRGWPPAGDAIFLESRDCCLPVGRRKSVLAREETMGAAV